MIGRLLNSLNYRVNREEREWCTTNATRRELAYPWCRRLLMAAVERPLVNLFTLLFWVLVLMPGTWIWREELQFITPEELEFPELVSYFASLWTVQAAIAALVYPIVIGFVTLLLQRRHTAKARLQIYLHDSAAVLSGLSSLFLVLAMAIQYVLLPQVEIAVGASWVLMDSLWFVGNVAGAIWFMVRTFAYLQPDVRADATKKYAVNVAWPRELRRHLQHYLFVSATEQDYLPGKRFGDPSAEQGPSIWTGFWMPTMGDVEVVRQFKKERQLVDVYFALLRIVAKRWLKRAERVFMAKEKPDALLSRMRAPVLIFPLLPEQRYREETILCGVQGEVRLRRWEKLLIRLSFRFAKPVKNRAGLTVREILANLEGDVRDAIYTGEEVAFDEALNELTDFHATMLEAGATTNLEGNPDNL